MKSGLLSILLAVFGAVQVQAQVFLVSDIDDTVKLAHIQSYKDAFFYALDDESRFLGMSELYQAAVRENPDLQVVYLSAAPTWLMEKRHRQLLQNGSFPAGRYIGRSHYSSEVHKFETLKYLISQGKPKTVILIGDNGEKDALVYQRIRDEFRAEGIQFLQFIRIVYSPRSVVEALSPEQVNFVTPFEIAMELEKNRLLSGRVVEDLFASLLPEFLKEKRSEKNKTFTFPYFVNCAMYRWQWDDQLPLRAGLVNLKHRIHQRCGLGL